MSAEPTPPPAQPPETEKVSTLELYFDLVFVFIVTQVTHMVEHAHGPLDVMKGMLVLGITWWMYGGYAWLTNHVSTSHPAHRLWILLGMAGFLMIGVSVPHVFTEGGMLFGVGFMLVVLVHTVLFTRADSKAPIMASLRMAPYHLLAAVLALGAGFTSGQMDWILLGGAFSIQFLSPLLTRTRGFRVQPRHFVERHGLVMIIALGEAVVAIGTTTTEEPLVMPLIMKALMGLVLTSALWWSYFAGESQAAERALEHAQTQNRSKMALAGYGYAHLGMIVGIVLLASSIQGFMVHPSEQEGFPPEWLLAWGLCVYLLSDVFFRIWLSIGLQTFRLGFALLMPVLGWVASHLPEMVQLSTFTLALVLMVVLEQVRTSRLPR
ncbi:low temperature requirement protein A [Deinococcus cellulosilyticus]|uniref:Low temperature requirement protein A n=1 Tax=Deinococcus cellulosilyticus (strain DSM 18568 / NBRC 106333 / KACC 11606 / 5516J-15) TaxID=1223518 RepID=A0A511MWN3_DEIC1|nr:low temperature requirement protein A [Deinococcus cellulosilyticus]GEM44993.1 low temperature requirement protein A [Deinococcus cellulosilyticus NBRC 106333 = KACC 11606]